MSAAGDAPLSRAARRLLQSLASTTSGLPSADAGAADALIKADLARRTSRGAVCITAAGRSYLAREAAMPGAEISAFRAQHMTLTQGRSDIDGAVNAVLVNASESPLAWLARRKGRDGRTLIAPVQFVAGERLRADFTRAQMTPRVTSSWSSPMASGRAGGQREWASDLTLAARQRVRRALDAVGPELAGPLLDVCCFLQGLEDVERARGWPPRSAKVVLQLGLERLAHHYGLQGSATGPTDARLVTWLAEDAVFAP